jgi:methylenetetrahydrofolate reductase (NADPH)
MALLSFRKPGQKPGAASATAPAAHGAIPALIEDYSIEVMPRTAEKVEDFRALLPAGTRVYIAHVDGTEIEDMVRTARRLRDEGFEPMPHFPARSIPGPATLADWIRRYQVEAGVKQGLILGGGISTPRGEYHSSMQLLESGFFDDAGFTHLHVAGHPEGNRDIDRDGGEAEVMAALKWKQDFANRSDASFAIATQFAFEAGGVVAWAERLAAAGIEMPVHLGVAGPAKLQTLIKFAIACGVGKSLGVLQKRAKDVTKLLMPFEPTDLLNDLAARKAAGAAPNIERIHFFPLGGIKANAEWAMAHGGAAAQPASAASVA